MNEFSGDNVDGSTNIIPKMGLEPLREGYRKILSQIYAPKFYYERVMTFLREYQPPKIRIHLEPQYILALGRSIYQLGIRGVERVQYWRLFFWTLFRRPRLFPLAITLAIYGFPFPPGGRPACQLILLIHIPTEVNRAHNKARFPSSRYSESRSGWIVEPASGKMQFDCE